MSLARYTYATHATRGFQPTDSGIADLVVTVPGSNGQAKGSLDMLTAADVVGIPATQVVRSWPRDGSRGVEPNYLPLVEFDSPDVPWLFSRPAQNGRIEPWLALVVVDVTDTLPAELPMQQSDTGLRLTVDADELPDPSESWLWSHVQFLGDDVVPDDPGRSLARLISPRRLAPDRDWLACVVPTLESARLAGVGETDQADAIRTARTYAWAPGGGTVVLPVYHSFTFSTGDNGDFEALVRRLHGMPLPDGMGRRRLRIDHPLAGLPSPVPDDPAVAGADLVMHVALRPPAEQDEPIRPLVGADYATTLLSRLADAGYDLALVTGPDAESPRVGPPVYGQLAAGAVGSAGAIGAGAAPPWLAHLNVDPRLRVAAGLGAEIVRRDQDHYAESAWKQVGDVLAANRLRRRAELSLGASLRLYTRWIATLDSGMLLATAAPVLAKTAVTSDQTVRGALATSSVTAAAVSVELRRQTRTRGAFAPPAWSGAVSVAAVRERSTDVHPYTTAVQLDGIEQSSPPSSIWPGERLVQVLGALVSELDVSALTPAEAGTKLDAIGGTQGFALPEEATVASALASPTLDPDLLASSFGLLPASLVRRAVTDPATPATPADPVAPHGGHGPVASHLPQLHGITASDAIDVLRDNSSIVRTMGDRVVIDVGALQDLTATGRATTTLDEQVFDQIVAGTFTPASTVVESLGLSAGAMSTVRAELVGTLQGIVDRFVRPPDSGGPQPLARGLDGLRASVLSALDPRTTLRAAVNSRIAALPGTLAGSFDDIMPAPDLSEPTFDDLAAISHDWLLPGLDELPPDTTTLATSNRSFISALLVGVNHELARDLLWREYPTDQRATYARQFWSRRLTSDVSDHYDLKHELHRAATLSLAGLQTVSGDAGDDPLVLVIKGELIHRYPSLIIQAGHTVLQDGTRRMAEPAVDPDFRGLLEPDVLVAGFTALTLPVVLAAKDDADAAWWFFFSEHVSEPRFGLDDADGPAWTGDTWNDASWAGATLGRGTFLTATSFGRSLPKGTGGGSSFAWGADAATQAWITLQFPFRRGIPATDLLPPQEDE
ncbi:hypothetical protein [Nocardioides sp.]|uniref:hypothetical protein n=1 Tax=Nocardioides sp. TaxID=35761 RepID=UPI002F41B66C